ncbi:pentapeptide repeat-containing protein [Nocardia mikamii]|uniref:pentapeptide repeat-containing protein n=1 Tax=Nocardia mikamii TaxID=508464 RepID=UPI0012F50690|nr:pentapeptide repeat-containing protein [Nocardia mikamii]
MVALAVLATVWHWQDFWKTAAQPFATAGAGLGVLGGASLAFWSAERKRNNDAEKAKLDHDRETARNLRERFTSATAQFSSSDYSVRRYGAFALAALAADWHAIGGERDRDTCIAVLIGYLRETNELFVPPKESFDRGRPGKDGPVRRTIVELLADCNDEWAGQCGYDLSLTDLRALNLNGMNLSRASFRGARLDWSSLDYSDLSRADFTYASMDCSSLQKIEAPDAVFDDATLSGTNFAGAKITGASFELAKFNEYATLTSADATGAKFNGAKMAGANLQSATLVDAEFIGASLKGAYLSDADLSGARLMTANMCDANVYNANLESADLNDALLFPTEIGSTMPDLSDVKGLKDALHIRGAHLGDEQRRQYLYAIGESDDKREEASSS